MLDLTPQQLALVKEILARHLPGLEVRVFGSRVCGSSHQHSDLDLAIVGATRLDRATIGALREAFTESNLPMSVDLVDWHAISPAFRSVIERRYEVLQPSATTRALVS